MESLNNLVQDIKVGGMVLSAKSEKVEMTVAEYVAKKSLNDVLATNARLFLPKIQQPSFISKHYCEQV